MYNHNAVIQGRAIGEFTEKTYGRVFTYEHNTDWHWLEIAEFPHIIHMGDGSTRYANVLKTMVRVVTDELDDGSPLVESWFIKKHKKFK